MVTLEDALRRFAEFNNLGQIAIVELSYNEDDFRSVASLRKGGYRQRAHYTKFRKH